MQNRNMLCGQISESFNANAGGTCSNHCILREYNKFEMYNYVYDENAVKYYKLHCHDIILSTWKVGYADTFFIVTSISEDKS
jgi:hypothetical protein